VPVSSLFAEKLVSSVKDYTAAVSVESSSTIWSMMSWRISSRSKDWLKVTAMLFKT